MSEHLRFIINNGTYALQYIEFKLLTWYGDDDYDDDGNDYGDDNYDDNDYDDDVISI